MSATQLLSPFGKKEWPSQMKSPGADVLLEKVGGKD